jgi:hypothetical protein
MLLVAGRRLLGVVLLLLGIMMNFTFVLLPVGVPLALFAVALIAAPDDQWSRLIFPAVSGRLRPRADLTAISRELSNNRWQAFRVGGRRNKPDRGEEWNRSA